MFDVAANMNTVAWDILKFKFCEKIVTQQIDNRRFLMLFGGSSVTAGHDNYFHESYPIVFERRMSAAFEALNVKLIVHNIAQGSNDCYPYNFCYNAMGGDNADWIGWEQSYNCGRDKGVFELIARVAAWNKAVIYYSASGGFVPDTCAPSKDPVPWISEKWTPESSGIVGVTRLSRDDVATKRKELQEWFEDGDSVGKFVGALHGKSETEDIYRGVGAHGFNWFGNSKKKCFDDNKNTSGCNAIDVRGKCQRDGGPNWMTLEAAKYTATSRGKKWHPSAGMHLMRGEVIAYRYAYILLDAIYTVQEEIKNSTYSDLAKKYKKILESMQPDLITQKPSFCDKICEFPPICYTDFEPNYNPSKKLSNLIHVSAENDKKGWTKVQFKKDVPGLGNSKYGWLDRRPIFESTGFNSSIHVTLDVRFSSFALVCGYPVKESLKFATFFVDPNITVAADSAYKPSSLIQKWTRRKYFNSGEPSIYSYSTLSYAFICTFSDPLHFYF